MSKKNDIFKMAVEVCMNRLGRPVPSKSELKRKVIQTEEDMSKLWYGSDCKDFSFYSDPEYLYLALNSWTVRSMGDLDEVIRLKLTGPDPKVFLDFHGGIGMTSIRLAMDFPGARCIAHIGVQEHREVAMEIAKRFGLSNVEVTDDPWAVKEVDMLSAQEVFEHFRDPFAEVKHLFDETNPKRYLDGSSFGIDSPGHFPFYKDGDEVVPRKNRTRGRFNRLIRDRGFTPYWKRLGVKHPYNSHPYLWIRDDVETGPNEGI